jgi:hypothetical protein
MDMVFATPEVESATQETPIVELSSGPRLVSYWDGIQVYFVTPGYVVAARGYEILVKAHTDNEWVRVVRVPGHAARRWTAGFPILRTVSRSGIRLIAPIAGDKAIVFCDRRIYSLDLGAPSPFLNKIGQVSRGNGPLLQGWCVDSCGVFYYGEYSGDRERIDTHIYSLQPDWSQCRIYYTFPAGSVRHIHAVQQDPFSGAIWVATGDRDEESRIGFFVNAAGGPKLNVIASGDQRFRAVSLLFTDKYVYWGTDAQDRSNAIVRWCRSTGDVEHLSTVDGPVFYSTKDSRGRLFFTTAAERMQNEKSSPGLWMSADGQAWSKVACWKKHSFPTVFGHDVFGFGVLSLPIGSQFCSSLYVTGHSVQGAPGTWLLEI